MLTRVLGTIAAAACLSSTLFGDVRLPAIFGDHMVLQRDARVAIWGTADPDAVIEIRADWTDSASVTRAGSDGRWRTWIQTAGAGGPHTLSIRGDGAIDVRDVLLGDVWICSGQSNMEMTVGATSRGFGGVLDHRAELATADLPMIRLFSVERQYGPARFDDCRGGWQACSPRTAEWFSAVGFFFGRRLHQELSVPIGLISSSWGGTVAESWTSEAGLQGMKEFDGGLDLARRMRDDPTAAARQEAEKEASWWAALERAAPASLAAPETDDSTWNEIEVPGVFTTDGLDRFDGVLWIRRYVELPESWAGRAATIELGPIDDRDTTWFNGVRVGGHEGDGAFQVARRYEIPGSLLSGGRNLIAIRVVDTGGTISVGTAPDAMRVFCTGSRDAPVPIGGRWRYRRGTSLDELPARPKAPAFHPNSPTALFNGMIAPIVPFGIKGVIWYQGESNRTRARQYRELFPRLIADWRRHFDQGTFPFYFVQIAPFAYGGDRGEAAQLREAQRHALSVPNTGMVVTMDVGDPRDIHPKNKQAVGGRLALWALARTYGREDLIHSGPLFHAMEIVEGRARLHFEHVGSGLASDGPLTHFEVAGEDRVYVPAEAVIDGDAVVVWSETIAAPAAVRFGFGAADETNLRNREGLPASSFCTDDVP